MNFSSPTRFSGALLVYLLATAAVRAVEPPTAPAATNETTEAVLRLRAEQQATRKAIEQLREEFREEAAATVRRNNEALTSRLHTVEQHLTAQRVRDLETLRGSNHETLLFAASLGGLGLIGMFVMGWFLFRATNQLSQVLSILPARATLGTGLDSAMPLLAGESAEASSARLFSVVDRLEKRLLQLEDVTGHRHLAASGEGAGPHTNGHASGTAAKTEAPLSEAAVHINALLGKGQSLLNLEKNDEALACFEEALALDPEHIETLIRRAKALEKMRRLKDALETYDRALAIDNSLTIAHLGKGGVFNRMERFTEALECYEKALRTQQGSAVEKTVSA